MDGDDAAKMADGGGAEHREASRSVFVTVGTTSFDNLIKAATRKEFYQLLMDLGYTKITLQIGSGDHTPDTTPPLTGLGVSWFRYKPTLATDMSEADLIISHGGSGSILEALSLWKPLVVVVNEGLMDNHQLELAGQLSSDQHLLCTTHKELYATVKLLPRSKLVRYEAGRPHKLGTELDRIMGFAQ